MSGFHSPIIKVDQLTTSRGYIYAVRDDHLLGGTKQRAIGPMVEKVGASTQYSEFIYASPFAGYAQIALAKACQQLGYQCTLFCEQDRNEGVDSNSLHELSLKAKKAGAVIHIRPTLEEAETAAQQYSKQKSSRFLLPLGFQCDEFMQHFRSALTEQWHHLIRIIGETPKTLWLPVGSGTFARVFREILPLSTHIQCVSVNELSKTDARIQWLHHAPAVTLHYSTYPFIAPTNDATPIPSSRFYDAKLWPFIDQQAERGDIWWNVAK